MATEAKRDGWLSRRMMRLTRPERWAVNSRRHARRTMAVATALLEHVSLPADPYCLEVGCGQGALARMLAEDYNAYVVATDYDPAQVAVARRRLADLAARIDLRVVDARDLQFDDAHFDAVFSFGVLHHITRGWQMAVSEVARVLKPGGSYVFTEMVVPSGAGRLVQRLLLVVGLMAEAELQETLAANGLQIDYLGQDGAMAGLSGYCMGTARKAGGHPIPQDAQRTASV